MIQFYSSFADEVYEKYFESKSYRWLALVAVSMVAAAVCLFIAPKKIDPVAVLIFAASALFLYQCFVEWLDYTIGKARRLEDVIWQVKKVQSSTWSTYKSGPLLVIKLVEVRVYLPKRIEFIEISVSSPWAGKLTEGKQIRFNPKHRYSFKSRAWEELYDIGPIWKKMSWQKTWLGNYACGVEEFSVRYGCWIGYSTCPGDTLQEAYEELVRTRAPKQVPPLSEFTEEASAEALPFPDNVAAAMKRVAQRISPHSPKYSQALREELDRSGESN